jgi:hypothetical protein
LTIPVLGLQNVRVLVAMLAGLVVDLPEYLMIVEGPVWHAELAAVDFVAQDQPEFSELMLDLVSGNRWKT